MTDLAVIQEDIASWLEVYYKKLNAYNDYRKKDALQESKAADINKNMN